MRRLLLPALASTLLLAGSGRRRAGPGSRRAARRKLVHGLSRHQEDRRLGHPRIAGRKSADIVTAMREYKSGAWPSSVMGRIAKGFDDSQIDAIAAWFAKQPE